MKRRVAALVVVLSLCGYGVAQADPITYTLSAVGTGSLGGNAFINAPFTITSTADTSQIFTDSSRGILWVPDLSATLFISGLGTATFASTSNFVNQRTGLVGISAPPGPGTDGFSVDILDVVNMGFSTYDLSTPFGPLGGDGCR